MNEPLFPKAKVHMSEFMRVDAIFHMMLETAAQLRKAGATPEQIRQYRVEAINGNPWIETVRWVSVG